MPLNGVSPDFTGPDVIVLQLSLFPGAEPSKGFSVHISGRADTQNRIEGFLTRKE